VTPSAIIWLFFDMNFYYQTHYVSDILRWAKILSFSLHVSSVRVDLLYYFMFQDPLTLNLTAN
jgi:hypothetical protein